ncbi:NADH dehydrogenase [ubiquinone] 1 beta subcomplex subunit 5, mitochondrial-like [Symsagittifera roscoffensis]|uniref:NADH dehydrogenase [ubiquinone] 1 beta subcomplex subunit 5, mitochondrial-like n=1 Tax=Symsagittifera roscoffensis TaxID=84072 RepID=UPI00307B7953
MLCGGLLRRTGIITIQKMPLLKPAQLNSGLRDSIRSMGDSAQSRFVMRLSRHNRTRFMRQLTFYLSLTGIPATCWIYYSLTRQGIAELVDTPEGYEPQFYEYYGHPITRFMAKHFAYHPQRHYEKELGKCYKIRETVLQRMCQERAKLINRRTGESLDINEELILDKYTQGRNFNEKLQLIQSPNHIYNAKNVMEYSYDKKK